MMKHLLSATRQAVTDGNLAAAIALALTLPDICASIDEPDSKVSRAPYERWCSKWLVPSFTGTVGPERSVHVFLGASDLYALRCAVLHDGSRDINRQRAQAALDSFQFVVPPPGCAVHLNQNGRVLQLQADTFVSQICRAVEAWAEARGSAAIPPWPELAILDMTATSYSGPIV